MGDHAGRDSIIRLFNVHKRFGGKHALNDISFDIKKNEFLYITGPSGAGKSTLLKLLYLGENLSEGQILIDGMNLSRIPSAQIPFHRRKIGIIFQDFKLIPTKTVFENVALVLEAVGEKRSLVVKKVNSVLRTAGIDKKANMYPPGLSGGEQQRVAVARAIIGEPKIILADEPTGSLDSESADIIMGLLRDFHSRGATVMIATHDEKLLSDPGSRIIHLNQGRMV